jgi:predicted nucleotidyltransferase/HEPN domain-containing protein
MATLPQTGMAAEPVVYDWSITGEKIDKLVTQLVEAYKPVRIVAFGSWARGEHTPDSDLDVAVIVDDDLDLKLADLGRTDVRMAVDKLVLPVSRHRRQAFALARVDHAIAIEGVVLYERNPSDQPFYPQLSPEELLSVKLESLRLVLKVATDDAAMLDFIGIPHEIAGFHGQQALEKLMKLWLAANDIVPEHTHNLLKLETVLRENGLFLPALGLDLKRVSEYAVTFRYTSTPEEEKIDIEALRLAVLKLREHVVSRAAIMGLDLGS